MIVRLTGILLDVTEEKVIVERDGIAWEILIPAFAVGELAAVRGREVTLHVYQYFEGNQNSGSLIPRLVGFPHSEEKSFFLRFLEVKGIGAKKALKALEQPIRRIARWIEDGDAKAVATLPGIGKRAAELILAQVRGKMEAFVGDGSGESVAASSSFSASQRDALEVLIGWGDARSDGERWLERAAQLYPEVDQADEWVRLAYRIKSGSEG